MFTRRAIVYFDLVWRSVVGYFNDQDQFVFLLNGREEKTGWQCGELVMHGDTEKDIENRVIELNIETLRQ